MPIASLCSKNAVSIDKDTTLDAASRLMREKNVGSLIVTEGNGKRKPIGVLTDRDIALGAFSNGQTAKTPVHRVMSSKNVVSIGAEAGIADAVETMERHGVRRIVVRDENQEICGIVSSDDILQLLARELHGIGRLVQKQTGFEPWTAEASASLS